MSRYHPALVALHWLLALMFTVALAGAALVLVKIPNTNPAKVEALRQHFAGGMLLATLMLIRLTVRSRTTHPPRATAGNRTLDRTAWLSHRLLYALVFLQAGTGLFMAVQTGLLNVLISGNGTLPRDFWAYPIRTAHYVLSRLLMAVIALHVAAALYHTFVRRDGLLRRMWFGRRSPVTPDLAAVSRGAAPLDGRTSA